MLPTQTDKAGDAAATVDRRRDNRIPSGVTIKIIDTSKASQAALEYFNKHQAVDGKEPATGMNGLTQGIVETSKGLYLLCTEGVGEGPIKESESVTLSFSPEWKKANGSMSMSMLNIDATITVEELRALPVTDEKPLEDFIRTFGRRLESNYSSWRRELTA